MSTNMHQIVHVCCVLTIFFLGILYLNHSKPLVKHVLNSMYDFELTEKIVEVRPAVSKVSWRFGNRATNQIVIEHYTIESPALGINDSYTTEAVIFINANSTTNANSTINADSRTNTTSTSYANTNTNTSFITNDNTTATTSANTNNTITNNNNYRNQNNATIPDATLNDKNDNISITGINNKNTTNTTNSISIPIIIANATDNTNYDKNNFVNKSTAIIIISSEATNDANNARDSAERSIVKLANTIISNHDTTDTSSGSGGGDGDGGSNKAMDSSMLFSRRTKRATPLKSSNKAIRKRTEGGRDTIAKSIELAPTHRITQAEIVSDFQNKAPDINLDPTGESGDQTVADIKKNVTGKFLSNLQYVPILGQLSKAYAKNSAGRNMTQSLLKQFSKLPQKIGNGTAVAREVMTMDNLITTLRRLPKGPEVKINPNGLITGVTSLLRGVASVMNVKLPNGQNKYGGQASVPGAIDGLPTEGKE